MLSYPSACNKPAFKKGEIFLSSFSIYHHHHHHNLYEASYSLLFGIWPRSCESQSYCHRIFTVPCKVVFWSCGNFLKPKNVFRLLGSREEVYKVSASRAPMTIGTILTFFSQRRPSSIHRSWYLVIISLSLSSSLLPPGIAISMSQA